MEKLRCGDEGKNRHSFDQETVEVGFLKISEKFTIFEIFPPPPNGILWGWGETETNEKNQKQKIS
jgi:hypothetical protein